MQRKVKKEYLFVRENSKLIAVVVCVCVCVCARVCVRACVVVVVVVGDEKFREIGEKT